MVSNIYSMHSSTVVCTSGLHACISKQDVRIKKATVAITSLKRWYSTIKTARDMDRCKKVMKAGSCLVQADNKMPFCLVGYPSPD